MESKELTKIAPCEIDQTLEILSGKWVIRIIYRLMDSDSPLRFSALKRMTPGITEKMLTARLRELEAKGVITRHIFPVVPPHVEYQLTERGRTLEPILTAMKVWGKSY